MEEININVVDIPQYIPESVYIDYSKIPNAGLGIFAKIDIKKGAFIGNYMGEIYDSNTELVQNDYIFTSHRKSGPFRIDGYNIQKTNFARFMNCCTNTDVENIQGIRYEADNTGSSFVRRDNVLIDIDGYIFFFAKRDIKKGEELLYDYGEVYRNKLGIKL
jgi:SET domain-containing protein